MNKDIQEKIFEEIPELNPMDPRSIYYLRELKYNNDILKAIIKIFIIAFFDFILCLIISFYFNGYYSFIINLLIIYVTLIKRILILSIKIYQNVAPEKIRNKCRYEPSCSNYALIVLKKNRLFKAINLIIKRIYKCSYTDGGGFEYIE